MNDGLNYLGQPTAPNGMHTNLAVSNKWFCYLPLEDVLPKKYKNIQLHVKRFSLPQMLQTSQTVSFKGYQKEIPTKVINAESKELTIEYLIDENWESYKGLYAWMSGGVGVINPVTDDKNEQTVSPSDYLTLRIFLLNNYKKKIIQFAFYNCWIKTFNDLALESDSSEEIVGSFTFCYDRYVIENV